MDIVTRISVTCFAASYALGLALEIARAFRPNRMVRWLATGFALAGVIAQFLYLLGIGWTESRFPIATQFESLIAVSWLISLVYVYLLLRDRRSGAGLFILPVSLGLVLFAATLAPRGSQSTSDANQVIAIAHGVLLLLGTVVVVFATIAALMYLVKVRQLKKGTVRGPVRLPSLERLDRLNRMGIWVAWPLLTLGLGLGLSLQRLSWTDPKVVWTATAWLAFTVLAHYRFRPEHRGRKIAVLTIVACLLVMVSVLGDPLFGTGHQSALGGVP